MKRLIVSGVILFVFFLIGLAFATTASYAEGYPPVPPPTQQPAPEPEPEPEPQPEVELEITPKFSFHDFSIQLSADELANLLEPLAIIKPYTFAVWHETKWGWRFTHGELIYTRDDLTDGFVIHSNRKDTVKVKVPGVEIDTDIEAEWNERNTPSAPPKPKRRITMTWAALKAHR